MKSTIKILLFSLIALIVASCATETATSPTPVSVINKIDFPALFIVNGESSDLYVLNLNTNNLAGKINLTGAKYPHHISMNRDKSLIAITCVNKDLSMGHAHSEPDTNGYTIFVLNTADGSVSRTISALTMPHAARFSQLADEYWIGEPDEMESNINILNTNSSSSMSAWPSKAMVACGGDIKDMEFSTTGKYVYTVNAGTSNVSVVSTQLKEIVATLQLAGGPSAISAGFDNKMYVSCEDGKSITIIDVATNTIEGNIVLGFKPSYTAFNATTGHLWVNDPVAGNTFVYEKVSGQWQKKTQFATGRGAHQIIFSKANIAYISNELDASISLIDAIKLEKIKNVTVGSKPNGLIIKE